VPPVHLSAVECSGAQVVRTNGLGILVLMLNCSKGPLADKRVRQAMNYAIDKDKIVKGLFGGAAKPLNGPYNDLEEGAEPQAPVPYPYNPDKAKQLLAEAGFANGFKITIDTPTGRYLNDKQTAEAAAGDLAKVGIEMAINPLEWGAMIKVLQEKQSDLWLLAQNSQDTYALTSVCFHSKIKGIPWLGYNSPEADALIEKGGQEMDDAARIDTFKKLRQLIVEDAPWVFLHASEDLYGVGAKVQGWKPKGDQVVYVYGTSVKS
jgi:peptide/nickel transport system substrate-binding protein